MNFQTPSEDGYSNGSQTQNIAAFLEKNTPGSLRPITAGSFSYSATRPVAFKKYFYDIFNTCAQINCGIEGWHTEGGPGVYEAVSYLDWHLIECVADLIGPQSMRRSRNGRQSILVQVGNHSLPPRYTLTIEGSWQNQ